MAWYRAGGGSNAEDGNDITYPVAQPSGADKLYNENDINEIALAIGQSVKVSEMANAVRGLSGGLHATRYIVQSETYSEVTT